jgi:hypothetical protein
MNAFGTSSRMRTTTGTWYAAPMFVDAHTDPVATLNPNAMSPTRKPDI